MSGEVVVRLTPEQARELREAIRARIAVIRKDCTEVVREGRRNTKVAAIGPVEATWVRALEGALAALDRAT